MTDDTGTDSPTPPWMKKDNAPQERIPQPQVPAGNQEPLSGLEAFLTRPGSAWAPIGVGFAGGFGAAALFLIFVSVFTKLQSREDAQFWMAIAGAGILGLILWSWFLSRVRIYRSQAQDPDFSTIDSNSKRQKRRGKRRASKAAVDEDDQDEEPDEDDEPWI